MTTPELVLDHGVRRSLPRRRAPRVAALAAAVAIAGVSVVARPAAALPAAALAHPSADPALSSLGACLVQQHAGDILLLIDESASLYNTDKFATRVSAAKYLMHNLADFAASAHVQLGVRLAGFDVSYHPARAWTQLSATTLPGIESSLDGFVHRNTGFETDYWTALDGARRDLASRPPGADGQQRCQAVVWFTDGKFELDYRKSAADITAYGETKPYAPGVELTTPAAKTHVEALGRTSLCRAGGLADAIRSAGITTLAVGLESAGTPRSQFDFLTSIATGRDATGTTCGSIQTPTPGDFHLASNVDEILFAFDAISDPGQLPAVDRTGRVCKSAIGCQYTYPFVLDASITKVHILAGADVGGIEVVLRGPGLVHSHTFAPEQNGQPRTLPDGVAYTWLTPRTLAVDLTQEAQRPGWTGVWNLTFVDPSGTHLDAVSHALIRISGDLVPAWPGAASAQLRSGDLISGLTFQIQHAGDSTPVPATQILGTTSFTASLIEADGTQVSTNASDVAKAGMASTFSVALTGVPPGPATMRLSLSVTTAAVPASGNSGSATPGTELAPQVVDVPVQVLPPLNFPTAKGPVTFPLTQGTGPAHGSVSVTGPGCVWVDSAKVTASPDGVGAVRVAAASASSPASCLHVLAGQTEQLPVTLSVADAGNGAVAGWVIVELAPEGHADRKVPALIKFSGELERPVQAGVFAGALAAALIIGLGLPPLFLLLTKWWTARIPSAGGLWLSTAEAVVEEGSVRGAGGGAFDAMSSTRTFVTIDASGQRTLPLPGTGLVLQTRAGFNPVALSTVVVESGDGRATVSDYAPHQDGDGRAVLPLAVHNHWVAWLGDPGAGGTGRAGRAVTVLVLASALASVQVYERITADIVGVLPDLVARLDAAAGDETPVPAGAGGSDAWGSSSQSGGLGGSDDFGPPAGSGNLGGTDDW